jgi:hypothetical protein
MATPGRLRCGTLLVTEGRPAVIFVPGRELAEPQVGVRELRPLVLRSDAGTRGGRPGWMDDADADAKIPQECFVHPQG